ncbi:MAG TPA: hypothetical protein VG387_00130 [Rhizomicrobium sp.]|jgi:hypothetical protein|nr:hypothetical protein [Rhizomicrobium sp.]
MTFNAWMRQIHRWLSLLFTAAVIANIVALVRHINAPWIGLLAFAPLIPLLLTGLYMFVLPYASKARRG